MPVLQELKDTQIGQAIEEAVGRLVPVCVTVPDGDRWANFHSRMVGAGDVRFQIELPTDRNGAPHEFAPAERIGLSFKIKHHKHIFSATVAGVGQYRLHDGTDVPVLELCYPTGMQRLQRRAYMRVDIPPNRIVRASFWLGGRLDEPAGTTLQTPVWSGRVANLSAGGFQMIVGADSANALEVGDPAGVRLAFGAAGETVYADAQFRHAEIDGEKAMLGFQFIGLGQTPEGCDALDMISAKVAEYHRLAEHSGSRSAVGAR